MPKGRTALLRSVPWLAVGIVVVVLALAVTWVLFVPAADWLARHDVGSAKGPLLQTARDAARGRLLTLGTGLFAAGALLFTARNFTLSRRTSELAEQGQVTDRYTKAIEQLGSKELDVRIGGIYALERVARDSARDHPTVMEVLTAFIREHSREPWPPPASGRTEQEQSTRPDIQAAVAVVGRRDASLDIRPIDLTVADLAGAVLACADLAGTDLSFAIFTGANLAESTFAGALLTRADLSGTLLIHAILEDAFLSGALLVRARLDDARLISTALTGATLTAPPSAARIWQTQTSLVRPLPARTL